MSFRCIIIQDAQSYSENSGTGGTLWRNPNELSQNTEVIICQHTSRYCFCPVIIGRFPIFPAEAFIFITVWRLGSVIPTAVRWRSTEKNRLSMPEMSPFFPAMFHIPLTVHQARKATGLIFSWIRRNCSAISSRLLEKLRPVHGRFPSIPLYFQQRGFSPHQLSGISYHPRAGRAESLLSDQCQKPVMLPLY